MPPLSKDLIILTVRVPSSLLSKAGLSESFISTGSKGTLGTVQEFIVPGTSQYLITAYGARGGTHSYDYVYKPGTYLGGKGAKMQGLFYLTKGTVLQLVVGQKGDNSVEIQGGAKTTKTAAELGIFVEDNAGTGGGGGSFVYTSDNNLLIAAGGGGGASAGYSGRDGEDGPAGSKSRGSSSPQSRNRGTGGQPGECNSAGASYHGGVGAGWLGRGCSRQGSSHGEPGGSRGQGWFGGVAGYMNSGNNDGPAPGAVGGFGGGGGGSEDKGASGGGGGYSGVVVVLTAVKLEWRFVLQRSKLLGCEGNQSS